MATNTATSFTDHTGNNTAGPFNISFNYLDQNEVDVIVDGALKTINAHYTFTTASTISFTNSNFPAQNAKIRFQRDTNISAKKVDFSDGSVLTESDLDLQNNQLLYGLQESIDTITHDYFQLDGSQCLTGNICFEGATTDDNETHFGVTDPTADQTYLLPNLGAGTYAIHTSGSPDIITNTHIASGTIIDDNVAPNADIKGTKIEPEFGSQVIRQKVSGYGMDLYPNCQISFGRTNDISSGMTMKIGPDTIGNYDGNSNQFIDNNINLGHPNLGTPGGLGGWSNEINSANGHRATILIGRLTMTARKQNHSPNTDGYLLRADGRDGCMFYSPDNSSFGDYDDIPGGYMSTSPPSTSYTGSVTQNMDRCRDAADFRIINGGAKANNKLEIGSATTTGTLSLSGKDITSIIINSAAVAHTANDASVFTTSGSDARYFRQDTSETITSGITWSGDDAHVATTGAIDARIVDLIDDVGGFVPIANETSFPNANPDVNNAAGTLLSVPLANNITSNGSGVISIANGTIGNSTVTINGAANNTTYSTGFGIIVETTSTLNTYTFHRYVPKATEVTTVAGIASNVTTVGGISANVTTVAGISSNVTTVAGAITNVNNVGGSIASVNTCATNLTSINNFGDKYQVAGSNPSTDGGGNALAAGDLYFDTAGNQLKVYNGSAWQGGVTATGDLLAKSGDQMTGNLTFSGNQTVDGRDVSVDGTKLDGIAANANNYSISSDLLDEDNMAANSATKVASQQSIKAYVDTEIAGVPQGDITGVTAGNGLTGGGTSGAVTLTVVGGTGITANADDIAIDSTVTTLTGSQTLTNKTLTSAVLNTGVSGTAVLDEDNMASNSATQLASQQSIKAYVDTANALKASLSGATFTGDVIFDGATAGRDITYDRSADNLIFSNNAKCAFGDSSNLSLYFDGTDSYIVNLTNELIVKTGTNFELKLWDGTETAIKATGEGSVDLYHDGSLQCKTASYGLDFADSKRADFGDDNDLIIYHNGNNAYIHNATGWLTFKSDNISIANAADNSTAATFESGVTKLYHDNSKKFETIAGGVKATGYLTCDGIYLNSDNEKAFFGTNQDLQIYHDGTNSVIQNTTGNLYLLPDSGGYGLALDANGASKLYWDGGKKLETTSSGILVTGNVDAGTGSFFTDDDGKYFAGTAGDLSIYHTGSNHHSNIRHTNGNGNLYIDSAGSINFRHYIDTGGTITLETFATFNDDGAVDLYYDGAKIAATYNGGFQSLGHIDIAENLYLYDGKFASFGNGVDLKIYHSTDNNSYIEESGSGSLVIKANDLYIQNAAGSHTNILADSDAAVELFYNGAKRISTTGEGGDIGPHAGQDTWLRIIRDTWAQQCGLIFKDNSGDSAARDWYVYQRPSSNSLEFYSTGVNRRRMALTSLGYLKAGDTVAWTDATTCHEVSQSAANWTFQSYNGHGTNPYGIQIYFPGRNTGSDDANNHFINCHDNTAVRFRVFGSGDTENQNNSWGAVSDIKLKENIVDASSQWDDIKNIKVRNFNFKTNSSKKLLGVVAQEIETISPGLVNETVDRDADNNDLGTTTKSVKYSILYMKAIKALQEAMGRIEVLETEVAALKGA